MLTSKGAAQVAMAASSPGSTPSDLLTSDSLHSRPFTASSGAHSPSKSLLQVPSPVVMPTSGVKRGRSPVGISTSSSSVSSSNSASDVAPPPAKRKRVFHRELKYMMHGFGDDPNPYTETVDLVEDLVLDFITETTRRAMEVGKSGKIHISDIVFLIRKDRKKYARVQDLLRMNEELKKARKDFTEADI